MPRWDNLTREHQAELCRHSKPWAKSTGPRSRYGKLVASQNAKKHRRRFQVAPGDMAQELDQALDHSDVTVQKTRDIRIGDRAKYTGSDPAIASICCKKKLEIFAMQEGWAVCWVPDFPGLVTVPIGELEQV